MASSDATRLKRDTCSRILIELVGRRRQRINDIAAGVGMGVGDHPRAFQRRRAGRHGEAECADEKLPDDTRLWAALQNASGGTWAGCVYDVDRIIELLEAGKRALAGQ